MYIFILMTILISQHCLFSQEWEENFKRGLKSFMAKDYATAVTYLDRAYKSKPDDERIKTALMRALERHGEVLFDRGNYEAAERILKRAISLGSTTAPTLHKKTLDKLREIEERKRRPVKPPRIEPSPEEKPEHLPEPPPAPAEKIFTEPVKKIEPATSPIAGMIPFPVFVMILIGIILFVIIFTYVITTVLVKKSIAVTRSDEVKKYQDIILQMLQEKQMLTQQEQKIMVTLPSADDKYNEIVVISPEARKKAKRIEIIEQALKDEKRPEVVEQLVGPFLSDPNNRVRANAAKAIYKHNKRLALETLKEMIESGDKWMILSACWVFEQIKDLEGLKLVAGFLNHPDKHIKQRAFKAVESILSSHPPREIEKIKKELPQGIEIQFR